MSFYNERKTTMQDQIPTDAGVLAPLLAKFLPAALGAAIMILVDPPKSRRDLFIRVFVAMACSILFGELVFDWLRSMSVFSWLDPFKRAHVSAIDGIVGAVGFSVASGSAVWLRRFRKDPIKAIDEVKGAAKP